MESTEYLHTKKCVSLSVGKISRQETNKVQRQLLAITKRFEIHAQRTSQSISDNKKRKQQPSVDSLRQSYVLVLGPGQEEGAFNSCARFPLGLIAGSAALMLIPILDVDADADDSRPAWNFGLFDIYKFSGGCWAK